MTTDARQTLNLEYPAGWHDTASNPFRDRLLCNPQLPGESRLPPRSFDQQTQVAMCSIIHNAQHYRYFLFFQQVNPVGSDTGGACTLQGVPNNGKKDQEKVRVGRMIAAARKKQRLTQAELAEKMGIRQQSIAEWESGETLPRGGRLSNLLKALPSLRAEFPQIARVAHHFMLSLQEWMILSPEQQRQVDDLILLIENIVRRAAGSSRLTAPPKS